MHANAAAHSAFTTRLFSLLLLAAHTLFLWMFLSADSVARDALDGAAAATLRVPALAVERLAAQWKHGMAGNSPLYMPGFFAVGLLTWVWSIGRPLRTLAAEWVLILGIAIVLAGVLTPLGAAFAVESFAPFFGVTHAAARFYPSLAGIGMSVFTLFTWTVSIFCLQRSVARRSARPMLLPLVLHYVLLRARPWAVNDFTTQWIGDVSRGLPVAVLSLVAVPVLLAGLVLYQLRKERLGPRSARA